MRQRLVLLLTLALLVAAVFAFVGLPIGNLGVTSVNADYVAECAAKFQARYPAPPALYADSALTQFVGTLSKGVASKLLICDDTFTAQNSPLKYLKVTLSGKIYYTSPAGVGIVPRNLRDSE